MTDEEIKAYAVLSARQLGVTPDAESMAVIVANLKILRAQAALFTDLPLDDHLDPATVLRL